MRTVVHRLLYRNVPVGVESFDVAGVGVAFGEVDAVVGELLLCDGIYHLDG